MNRRFFILGTIAAPAIVRPMSLMPIKTHWYRSIEDLIEDHPLPVEATGGWLYAYSKKTGLIEGIDVTAGILTGPLSIDRHRFAVSRWIPDVQPVPWAPADIYIPGRFEWAV